MLAAIVTRLNIFHLNRFHLLALLTWQFEMFFATQMLFSIFGSYVPRWRCRLDPPQSSSFAKNCTLYEECRGYIEFEHTYFHSAALEYEWICGARAYIGSLVPQVQFAGVFAGTIIFGNLADWLGRKPVSIFTLLLGISMLVVSGVAPNQYILIGARFCVGLAIGGAIVVVTLVMEMILPEQRMVLRAFFNWGWARLWMTGICYIFPSWRVSSYVCALVSLPTLLIILFAFPESPTWLHSKNRWEQMRNSERWIAKVAGVEYVEVVHDPLPAQKEGLLELARDPALLKRIITLWVMWFASGCSGYAVDLNSGNLVGNLFLNQALFSLLMAGSKIVLVIFDTLRPAFSRRNLHHYSQAVVIACFLALSVLVITHNHSVWILVVNLIGLVCIEYTWDANYLCAVETMPTEMRASSIGSCSAVARIGAAISPTLAFLNSFWSPSTYLAVTVLGSVSLATSYAWLVETKGVNLDKVKLHEANGGVGGPAGAKGKDEKGEERVEMLESKG